MMRTKTIFLLSGTSSTHLGLLALSEFHSQPHSMHFQCMAVEWNGSFIGYCYELFVDDKKVDLNLGITHPESKAKEKIIDILKNDYNIEIKEEEINFKWGGRL